MPQCSIARSTGRQTSGGSQRLHRRGNPREHLPPQPRRSAMPQVKPVPDGYRSITPYLIVADGAGAVAFYRQVFGATVRLRLDRPDGKIGHAELDIGDSVVMLADEFPPMDAKAPAAYGG